MSTQRNRPEIEALIRQRLHSGAFASVEDVLFDVLEIQGEREVWLQESKKAINEKIERGMAQGKLAVILSSPGRALRKSWSVVAYMPAGIRACSLRLFSSRFTSRLQCRTATISTNSVCRYTIMY
jgi:hypothetical protein